MTEAQLATLTGAVSYANVITGIVTVAGVTVGVYVAWRAAKMVLAVVRGL